MAIACGAFGFKSPLPKYRPPADPNTTVWYTQNGVTKKWEDWAGHDRIDAAWPEEPKPLDPEELKKLEELKELEEKLVHVFQEYSRLKQLEAEAPRPIDNPIQLVQKLLNKKGREELRAEYLNSPKWRRKAIKAIALTIVVFALTYRLRL